MSMSEVSTIYKSFVTFGDLLKFLRRRVQLTQRELAIAVGYSEGQINRLERNQRTPDRTTLLALFVPALDLEHEPEVVDKLTELAMLTRGKHRLGYEKPTQHVSNSSVVVNSASTQSPRGIHTESHDEIVVSKPINRFRLPQYLSMLIGRDQETEGIKRLLIQTRLVTMVGMGGIGKTRLAIEVGSSMVEHFKDGVCLVELANVTEPSHLAQSIAAVLGIAEQPGRTSIESLEVQLAQTSLLLILDNCEHLIANCAGLVEQLLSTTAHLKILATSREALRIPGEIVWRVLPLATPTPTKPPPVAQMQTYGAIELFVKRAQAVQPTFRLTDENAKSVVLICHRLDGLPLAIEMAAARIIGLTVDEIAIAIDDRFNLLISGNRTAMPRQQTLRATLDWSYALLTDVEQKLLARLSIFIGGSTATAVKIVCGEGISVLLQLVQKSLVVAIQNDEQTRYYLLETIREYAREKMSAIGENELISERHLAFFLALVEETMDLGGWRVDEWVQRVAVEHDNIRTAFTHACRRADDGEMALRLAGGMRCFRHHRGFYTEGLAWLNQALTYNCQGVARAKALLAKATLLTVSGDNEQSWDVLAEESLRIFRAAGDSLGSAWSLELLSGGSPLAIDEERLSNAAQEAAKLFAELDCPAGLSRALRSWSSIMLYNGNQSQAESLCETALEVAQKISDAPAAVTALLRLSLINPKRAIVLSAEKITQLRETGTPYHLARYLQFYGEFQLAIGEIEAAEAALHESLTLWQGLALNVAMTSGIAPTLQLLGLAAQTGGNSKKAMMLYREALKLYEEAGSNHFVYITRILISSAAIMQGEYANSAADLRRCLLYFQREQDILLIVLVVCQMAELARSQGFFSRCAKLSGAVERYERHVRFTFHMSINGVMRLNFVKMIAKSRTALTDANIAAAWSEGQAMSLTEVIAFVMNF